MDGNTLELLLHQIAAGRDEDQRLEWKRKWWDLARTEGKDEFRRDVAAIANGTLGDSTPCHILVGVKEGRLFDSPLPGDEADLQEILSQIEPIPSVSFEEHVISRDGVDFTVTVVEVGPPFNPPYVYLERKKHSIPIRRGSRIGTATRKEIDSFYWSRSRAADIDVTWLVWDPLASDGGLASPTEVLELSLPKRDLDQIRESLDERLRAAEEANRNTGFPSEREIERFRTEIETFLGQFESASMRAYWCQENFDFFYGSLPVSVRFDNDGTSPASGVRCEIELPDGVFCFSELDEPEGWLNEPSIAIERPRPPRRKTAVEALAESFGQMRGTSHLLGSLPLLPSVHPPVEPIEGSWYDEGTHRLGFWCDRVVHANSWRIDSTQRIALSPWAGLQEGEELELVAEVFCEQFTSWQTRKLRLRCTRGAGCR